MLFQPTMGSGNISKPQRGICPYCFIIGFRQFQADCQATIGIQPRRQLEIDWDLGWFWFFSSGSSHLVHYLTNENFFVWFLNLVQLGWLMSLGELLDSFVRANQEVQVTSSTLGLP